MKAFFIFVIMWPLMVYYPIAHWVWGGGWLSGLGVLDFAGGVTIHTVAGVAGMVVSLCLQKRRNVEKLPMTHHLVITWSSLGHHLVITWSSVGHHLVTTWSSLGHYLVISWSSVGHQLVITWSSVGHQLV